MRSHLRTLAVAALALPALAPGDPFTRVVEGRVALDEGLSRGAAWGDYDRDGDLDLFVANSGGQWSFLYRNDGGGRLEKLRGHVTVARPASAEGVNWVDVDDDGDLDLFVSTIDGQPSLLFAQTDSGFVRVTDDPLVAERASSPMACWADFDLDGRLDAYVVRRDGQDDAMFRNAGGRDAAHRFERVTSEPFARTGGEGRACAVGDIDGDGDADLLVTNARQPRFLFRNDGAWRFTRVTAGPAAETASYAYGASFADWDADGDLDLLVTNIDRPNTLYRNDGRGNFAADSIPGLTTDRGGASKGHAWGDFDNDGRLDLFVANGTYAPAMVNWLYWNRGDGRFERETRGRIATDADTSAGVTAGDYDGDGDLDLFVSNWGSNDAPNALYRNEAAPRSWLVVRPEGRRSNRMGIGLRARAKATIAGRPTWQTRWHYLATGYGSQNAPELHFGLGDARVVDTLELRWPSGQVDVHVRVPVGRALRAVEGEVAR
jgi:enediyne biosynthesis protein E4